MGLKAVMVFEEVDVLEFRFGRQKTVVEDKKL